MSTGKRIFARDATGLVRELSTFDAFNLNAGQMSAATGWYAISFSAIAFPNSDLALIMVLSTIIVFFVSYVYGQLSCAMPRSGGDYVWLSRGVNPILGFMMNFYFTAYMLIVVGLIAVPTIVMPSLSGVLMVAGVLTNSSYLTGLAATVVTPANATIIGIAVLVISGLLSLIRVRTLYRVLLGMFIVSIAGLLLTIVLLDVTPSSAFAAGFDTLVGTPGAYANVIKQATANGYLPGSTFSASLLALPFGIQSLTGWQFSSYVGGEVKSPSKKLPMSIILALIINGILYVLLFNAMYNGLGYDFANASVYLQSFYPKLYPSSLPALLPYLMIAMPVNPALVVFAVFSFFIAALWLVVTYFPFSTRNILAWSFDGVTPRMFADVSDRFNTPTKAVGLSLVFSILGVFVAYYTGWASATSNLIVGYNFMLMVVMLCAMTFPFTTKGKAILQAAPTFAKQKIGPLPIIVLFGLIGAIGTGFTFYAGLTNPLIGGAITPGSGGFVLSLFIIPVIIYYISKAYRKSQGIDLSFVFQQLPPE